MKKAQVDFEFNPAYVLLAILGGVIGWFVSSRAVEGRILPIITGILAVLLVYVYLMLTE